MSQLTQWLGVLGVISLAFSCKGDKNSSSVQQSSATVVRADAVLKISYEDYAYTKDDRREVFSRSTDVYLYPSGINARVLSLVVPEKVSTFFSQNKITQTDVLPDGTLIDAALKKPLAPSQCLQFALENLYGQFLTSPGQDTLDQAFDSSGFGWAFLANGELCLDGNSRLTSFSNKSILAEAHTSNDNFLTFLFYRGLSRQPVLPASDKLALGKGITAPDSIKVTTPRVKVEVPASPRGEIVMIERASSPLVPEIDSFLPRGESSPLSSFGSRSLSNAPSSTASPVSSNFGSDFSPPLSSRFSPSDSDVDVTPPPRRPMFKPLFISDDAVEAVATYSQTNLLFSTKRSTMKLSPPSARGLEMAAAFNGRKEGDIVNVVTRSLDSGKRVDGFLALKQKLGEGSTGRVYHVEFDQGSPVYLALKEAQVKYGGSAETDAMLIRELEMYRKISQEVNSDLHVIRRYDAKYDTTSKTAYLLMDRAAPLGDTVHFTPQKKNVVGAQIIDAFAWLREKKMAHRDIKLANIMLDLTDGRAKLVDFGLATTDVQVTNVVGTRVHMAPELASASDMAPVDALKVDDFAIGSALLDFHLGFDNVMAIKRAVVNNPVGELSSFDLQAANVALTDGTFFRALESGKLRSLPEVQQLLTSEWYPVIKGLVAKTDERLAVNNIKVSVGDRGKAVRITTADGKPLPRLSWEQSAAASPAASLNATGLGLAGRQEYRIDTYFQDQQTGSYTGYR